MSAAAIKLTLPQEHMLIYLSRIGADGSDAARRDPVLCALERRGLAEYRGTRARPRIEAWHATPVGKQWVDDARAAALAQDV